MRTTDGETREIPVADALGVIEIDRKKLPVAWKALPQMGENLLQGLAIGNSDSGIRVYLCPLPVPPKTDDGELDPERDMSTVFTKLGSEPHVEAPEISTIADSGKAYAARLGDRNEAEGYVWRFVLQSSAIRVLVICTWEKAAKVEPGSEVEALLRAVRLRTDEVRTLPGRALGEWVDWVDPLITPLEAMTSKSVYTYVWNFDGEGGFHREGYAGNPPVRVEQQDGRYLYIGDRYLMLHFGDGTMQIIPADTSGRFSTNRFTLGFRSLYDRDVPLAHWLDRLDR